MKIEDIIKKDFYYTNNLIEIEDLNNLKSNDFIYVIEVNNNDNNNYSVFNSYFCCLISNYLDSLTNRNIEEIDNENNILTNEEIIDLYEKHYNCKLYFFKEKTK